MPLSMRSTMDYNGNDNDDGDDDDDDDDEEGMMLF
jgi:hypothetical protein